MTLHDVQRLFNHWRKHPPLRVIVMGCAAALGVKIRDGEESDDKPRHMTAEEAMSFVRQTANGRAVIGG